MKTGKRWETTPLMIAEGISKGLAQKVVCARVLCFCFTLICRLFMMMQLLVANASIWMKVTVMMRNKKKVFYGI